MSKLTFDAFVEGTIEADEVTLVEIIEFAERSPELGVDIKKGMSKTDALNALATAIEKGLQDAGDTKAVEEGLGSKFLNRRKDQIEAAKAAAAPLSVEDVEAGDSNYQKRRLKKKA